MENSGSKRKKNSGKSKLRSVDIIRDSQPLKYRQIQEDDDDWVEGCTPSSSTCNVDHGVSIQLDALPGSPKKKRVRRATAQDKGFTELVHKAHLLCLIARGRLIDAACDDPLIQASLLSLLPPHMLKLSDATKLTANSLTPLVSWFHSNFHVKSPSSAENPFQSALASALGEQGGSPEEVAALSVALFRALNLTARFVSVLDVASLKPEVDGNELPSSERKNVFDSSTLMISRMSTGCTSSTKSSASNRNNIHGTSITSVSEDNQGQLPTNTEFEDSLVSNQLGKSDLPVDEIQYASKDDKGLLKKGDLEFQMQLQMAMSATALVAPEKKPEVSASGSLSSLTNSLCPLQKIKRITEESPSSSHAISTAIGSRKVGAPLHWAEVYCSGENMTGKWVHIDAVNSIVDGELKVEAAVAACKKSLRYVVAFAGRGVKDVTRRYCMKWYKISPSRINSEWWDAVLAPLKELESHATGGMFPVHLEEKNSADMVDSRSSLEDMELATRALTEPLPTSQQAYRTHPLYAIEKWLTKYQILHPKGPILGFCSGHAVYPRTCVQMLHTKERWLREGLQVKEIELPAKMVKSSCRNHKGQDIEAEDFCEGGSDGVVSLFGKWQTEPLRLPPAVDGIVPKNERGQVDVWSEKCLPPGTVHLRFPRLVPVAKRLGINFAPAMVGFEFRNGRSVPVYEGIVVCTEFREVILEAYAEEEQRREEEERKKEERLALSRWYQLLSSMIIRQRLNNTYINNVESETVAEPFKSENKSSTTTVNKVTVPHLENVGETEIHDSDWKHMQNHEHIFTTDDESINGDCMTRTKRCRCGVSIQVEEL